MTQVYRGPKGGFYILINKKKRYLKPEEAMAYSSPSRIPNKKLPVKQSKQHGRKGLAAWGKVKPKRGAEREYLIQKCGSECFLMPEKRKYPVCASSRCEISCNGVNAALNRARMVVGNAQKRGTPAQVTEHSDVLTKAKALKQKYKC
jgi:hypothetical protein